MLEGVRADVRHGYTGEDHLIDSQDETEATNAVAGKKFKSAKEALIAAEIAYKKSCDRRVSDARIVVYLRNQYGDMIEVG